MTESNEISSLKLRCDILQRELALCRQELEFAASAVPPSSNNFEEIEIMLSDYRHKISHLEKINQKAIYVIRILKHQHNELHELRLELEGQFKSSFGLLTQSLSTIVASSNNMAIDYDFKLLELKSLEASNRNCLTEATVKNEQLTKVNDSLQLKSLEQCHRISDLERDIVDLESKFSHLSHQSDENISTLIKSSEANLRDLMNKHELELEDLTQRFQDQLLNCERLHSSVLNELDSKFQGIENKNLLLQESLDASRSEANLLRAKVEEAIKEKQNILKSYSECDLRAQNCRNELDILKSKYQVLINNSSESVNKTKAIEIEQQTRIQNLEDERETLRKKIVVRDERILCLESEMLEVELWKSEQTKIQTSSMENLQQTISSLKLEISQYQRQIVNDNVMINENNNRLNENELLFANSKLEYQDRIMQLEKRLAELSISNNQIEDENEKLKYHNNILRQQLQELEIKKATPKQVVQNESSQTDFESPELEIRQLKETIRKECEERIQLSIIISDLREELVLLRGHSNQEDRQPSCGEFSLPPISSSKSKKGSMLADDSDDVTLVNQYHKYWNDKKSSKRVK